MIRYLAGDLTREKAIEIGQTDTRHYAKRQFTWFRHQLPEFGWVAPDAAREWLTRALSLSRNALEPASLSKPVRA